MEGDEEKVTHSNMIRLLEEDMANHSQRALKLKHESATTGYGDYLISEALKMALAILKKEMKKDG